MNGARLLDEALKRCVKRSSVEIKTILLKLQSELAVCNKLTIKVIKHDHDKSLLQGIVDSVKQIARDAKKVLHICTGEEQEAFFKCLTGTLKKLKAQRLEELRKKKENLSRTNGEKQITSAEIDQIIDCFTNSFTIAQMRLDEAEKRYRDCVKEAKGELLLSVFEKRDRARELEEAREREKTYRRIIMPNRIVLEGLQGL